MAVVDHYVSVKRAPAPGATARWPGNKQFDDVLLGRRYRLRTRPGVAGRWLGGPKPTFDLMLNRQIDAPAETLLVVPAITNCGIPRRAELRTGGARQHREDVDAGCQGASARVARASAARQIPYTGRLLDRGPR